MKSIYWDNVTDVDHAVLMPTGAIIGNSYIAKAKVTGNLNGEESVVVDFSTGKKDLKKHLDDTVDHKLWVNKDHFWLEYIPSIYKPEEIRITNEAESFSITLPYSCIYLVDMPLDANNEMFALGQDDPHQYIEKMVAFVNNKESEALSKNGLTTIITAYVHNEPNYVYFNYAHGLPKSTSFGCKNLGHGHLSYASLEIKPDLEPTLVQSIFNAYNFNPRYYLHRAMSELTKDKPIYFLPQANTFEDWSVDLFVDNELLLSTVCLSDRGTQRIYWKGIKEVIELKGATLVIFDSFCVILLDCYSTIENLGSFFRENLLSKLHKDIVYCLDLKVSEGLSKGTII